jgi:hypothetical protein
MQTDTESPPKVMRRLDYREGLLDDDGEGAACRSPQHLNQNDAAAQQEVTSPLSPLPTTPQSRSRNTLSSRTSLLGRRLAEERSRNHQLRVELEHVKSQLEREMTRNNDDIVFDLNESFFSSSPVNTPTTTPVKLRGGGNTAAPALASAAALEEESNHDDNSNMNVQRIQELELALQIETQLRKDAQAKLIEAEKNSKILEQAGNNFLHIENDSPILEYLQRASHLINATNSNASNVYKNGTHNYYNSLHSIDEDDEEEDGDQAQINETTSSLSNIVLSMQEYEELVTAFHLEQQNNQDEMLSKNDVLWFFAELKWRFADIHRGLVAVCKGALRTNVQENNDEWKNCLIGLVDELEYSMQKAKECISDNNDKVDTNIDDELVTAMKRSYDEQLADQSKRISQLEADAIEREEFLVEMQKKMKQDYQLIEEVKKKIELSKEGTAARIRYLESMVQSLQVKLKKTQTQPDGKTNATQCNAPIGVNSKDNYASKIDSLAKALADSELKRAHLIDEFQTERMKYIAQYKQMNDVLKLFMHTESKF